MKGREFIEVLENFEIIHCESISSLKNIIDFYYKTPKK